MTFRDTMISRHKGKPDAVTRYLMEAVIDLQEAFASARASIRNDNTLSDAGRVQAVRRWLSENAAAQLYRVRRTVESCRARIDAERQKLLPPPPDKTDLAGAILRSDLRAILRGMSIGSQKATLLGKDADPIFRTAVLEAPRLASGVPDELRQHTIDAEVERLHPGRSAQLNDLAEDVALLETTAAVVVNGVIEGAGFGDHAAARDFIDDAVTAKMPALNEQVAIQTADFAKAA